MSDFIRSCVLLLTLLNPFLIVVYLADLIQKVDSGQFRSILLRASLIAGGVFCGFAVLGDTVFSTIMQAEFASFQIFGGIILPMIAIQFVFRGPTTLELLRGESRHLAGAVAMPILIGPGTISASPERRSAGEGPGARNERRDPSSAERSESFPERSDVGEGPGARAKSSLVRDICG